jgi:hypothetical protein
MNSKNRRHVPFDVFTKFFERKNYFLFGVYEQVNEWPTKEPHLRRTNPVFISDKIIKRISQTETLPTFSLVVVQELG